METDTLNQMKRYLFVLLLGLLALSAALPTPARADGLMVIAGVYRQPAVSHINVRIEDKIATTTLEQTFRNPLDKQVTASYMAPVPPGATLLSFAQLIDGKWQEAEVKDSDQAKKEFDQAAEKGQDAALTSGGVASVPGSDPRMTFQTNLVLPPQSERKVRLIYTEVLSGAVGLTRYTYALNTTNLTDEPVGDLLVKVEIVEKDEIRAVYSPSHNTVEISRDGTTHAEALYRAQNVVPDQDFELVYTQSADQFGLNLASYRDAKAAAEDGYFVLIAAPQLEAKQTEVIQKDFVFVLDRSGSMNGPKFEQARAALKRILDALNPGDRFTVITFSSDVLPFSKELLPLERRNDAKNWIDALQIDGGTNINASLLTALGTVEKDSKRPHIVVFLTDGQATEGVTGTRDILANVRKGIQPTSRLYTIGIGDVNRSLLESLAQENRGTALFLDAHGDLEKPLASYYAAIDSPVLVDLALDFGGMQVYDLYPNPLPDMFLGGQIVLAGRYKGGGTATVTLTGSINGQPHVSTYKDIQFIDPKSLTTEDGAKKAAANSFVPRLWAQRKVEALVRQMEINGSDERLVEEVKTLGMRYKIVTPYTSFVVVGQQATPLPKTGLPFLYVDEYRTLNTALLIIGAGLLGIGLAGLAASRRRI